MGVQGIFALHSNVMTFLWMIEFLSYLTIGYAAPRILCLVALSGCQG